MIGGRGLARMQWKKKIRKVKRTNESVFGTKPEHEFSSYGSVEEKRSCKGHFSAEKNREGLEAAVASPVELVGGGRKKYEVRGRFLEHPGILIAGPTEYP